jgi:hypothetical protein
MEIMLWGIFALAIVGVTLPGIAALVELATLPHRPPAPPPNPDGRVRTD